MKQVIPTNSYSPASSDKRDKESRLGKRENLIIISTTFLLVKDDDS